MSYGVKHVHFVWLFLFFLFICCIFLFPLVPTDARLWQLHKKKGNGGATTDHGNNKINKLRIEDDRDCWRGWGPDRKTERSTFLFIPNSLQNSSWDRCAFTDGRMCTGCWLLPVVCVCLHAEYAHCLAVHLMLAETSFCLIARKTKPIDPNLPKRTPPQKRHLNVESL